MPRILIVDDERRITRVFCELFQEEPGYRVSTAHDGAEALLILNLEQPELVVLDWRLKGKVEGKDVLTAIKTYFPATRVFVVTASIHSVKEIEALGADRSLLKPCENLKAEIKAFFSAGQIPKSSKYLAA